MTAAWRVLAVVAVLSVSASAATLSSRIPAPLTPLADGLALSIGRAIPVTAASAGFSYAFDPHTNVFERRTPILGQLFIEKADTIGAGRWQVAAGWQRISFDTYEGRDLGSAGLGRSRFPGGARRAFIRYSGISMDLTVDEAIAGVTWGPREDLELNLALPVLSSELRLDSGPMRLTLPGRPVLDLVPAGSISASATGPGDLLLRAKWRALRGRAGRLAGGLVLQLPTGSRDDFQGTGEFELAPMLYASTAALRVWKIALEGHVNAGFRIAATDAQQSEGRWGVGLDVRPLDVFTIGLGVLGRHPIEGIGPGGGCRVPRASALQPGDCFFRLTTAPFKNPRLPISAVGLSTARPDFYDASFGVRVRVWRELLAFANVLVPLNRDGFRADTVPFAGLEAAF